MRARRRNADDAKRKVDRQVNAFLHAIWADRPGISGVEAQYDEIVELYGRELHRLGQAKNKLATQYRLLADMVRLESELNELEPLPGTGSFGVNRLLYLMQRGKKPPEGALGWHRQQRKELAQAVLGGLEHTSANMLLLVFNYDIPLSTWSPEDGALHDILKGNQTDIVIVWRSTIGRYLGTLLVFDPNTPTDYHMQLLGEYYPAASVDMLAMEGFIPSMLEESQTDAHPLTEQQIRHVLEEEDDPSLFGRFVWELWRMGGLEYQQDRTLSEFKQRFAIELAYEKRGWI